MINPRAFLRPLDQSSEYDLNLQDIFLLIFLNGFERCHFKLNKVSNSFSVLCLFSSLCSYLISRNILR